MDKMLRACLNWKVIAGLTALGLGIWFVAPNLLAAALPVLLIAVCPISMMLMMRAMQGQHGAQGDEARPETTASSPDVRLAELQVTREAIDREIQALEFLEPQANATGDRSAATPSEEADPNDSEAAAGRHREG